MVCQKRPKILHKILQQHGDIEGNIALDRPIQLDS